MDDKSDLSDKTVYYQATGAVAAMRLGPLVPSRWKKVDYGPRERGDAADETNGRPLAFLWENTPMKKTRTIRDACKAYSHLPNGPLLDSKHFLARIMGSSTDAPEKETGLAILETYCFKGIMGMQEFCRHVELDASTLNDDEGDEEYPDLMHDFTGDKRLKASQTSPLWVVKDTTANGVSGVWVVGPQNVEDMLDPALTPLVEGHRYIAQKYAYPCVLYDGRKCHVRVYALMTSDGKVYVHERCFLHLANQPFQAGTRNNAINTFDDAVHITNCCTNSHDKDKFVGEICASLAEREWTSFCGAPCVPLAKFAPSIHASVTYFANRAFPYVSGGKHNGSFEYLGLDFILSVSDDGKPIAYMLECNSPPSQDSATGLRHAEETHNTVIRDILNLWIIPRVEGTEPTPGGWFRVGGDAPECSTRESSHSNSASLNFMKWLMFENKVSKSDPLAGKHANAPLPCLPQQARTRFPYYQSNASIFFENAGGSQVPIEVIQRQVASLSCRDRSRIGAYTKEGARRCARRLLGAPNDYSVYLGSNATTLLGALAGRYRMEHRLCPEDEIILAAENHLANIECWTWLASETKASVVWWDLPGHGNDDLSSLLSKRTKLVVVSHVSNVFGEVIDLEVIGKLVKSKAPEADFIVDGVAAVPHIFADLKSLPWVSWYVISAHKFFGPHLGILLSREPGNKDSRYLEQGTVSYEACAGLQGVEEYLLGLSGTSNNVAATYQKIGQYERLLCERLDSALADITSIHVMKCHRGCIIGRIPLVTFTVEGLLSDRIVKGLERSQVVSRSGFFLSSERIFDPRIHVPSSLVRVSLAHYNTLSEIEAFCDGLLGMV